MFHLTTNAIPLSHAWEGPFKPKAWLDKVANPPVWTIAKGLTKLRDGDKWRAVLPDDEIDEEESEFQTHYFFREEIEPQLARMFHDVDLQPHQRDALASIAYNVGARSFPKTAALIQMGASMDQILDEWIAGEWNGALGLYRRRLTEALIFGFGWSWQNAKSAAEDANWSTDWRDLIDEQDEDIFEELEIPKRGAVESNPEPVETVLIDPTPETPWTTHDLNTAQLRELKKVAITPITKKVPVEAVDYLDDKDKHPGNITVKPIEGSQRGKGYKNAELGKTIGVVTVAGMAAEQAGAVEPVIKFVDKYSFNTIAMVFGAMLLLSVGLYYFGKWQRQKGEDEATDLLG